MSFKKSLRKGVFIVVYQFVKGKPLYLVLRRKLHWVGWEFPKGGVERFETKKHAVKREGMEETGLKLFNIKKHNYKGFYVYPRKFRDRIGYFGQSFVLYSAEVSPKRGEIKLDPREHTSFKWVNYEEALKKFEHYEKKKSLKIVDKFLNSKLK